MKTFCGMLLLLWTSISVAGEAQSYPSKPVRLIVPFAAAAARTSSGA